MLIPIIVSVRGAIFASIIVLAIGIFVMTQNSKDKSEYDKSTGVIEYLDTEYENLPNRHQGDFRYLKITNYPFLFEIFEPNSQPTEMTIDDLKVGDRIDIYYYETADTRDIGLNRFAQFIDHEQEPYFIRSGFQEQLGYVLIGISITLMILAFVLWKMRKLKW
jgi:hypothetical protein